MKEDMPTYPISDIKKDDLVLMESKITRYRIKGMDNKWSHQRVQMELLAVSLLHSADLNVNNTVKQSVLGHVSGLHI